MSNFIMSEQMALCRLQVSPAAAYHCVSALGEVALLQFRDLNESIPLQSRAYTGEVRRAEEMARKLRYLETEAKKSGITIQEMVYHQGAPRIQEIGELEEELTRIETQVRELSETIDDARKRVSYQKERHMVLEMAHNILYWRIYSIYEGITGSCLPCPAESCGYIVGAVDQSRALSFHRMLLRVSNFCLYVHTEKKIEIFENIDKDIENSMFFFIYYRGQNLKDLALRVCTGFKVNIYECSASLTERIELLKTLKEDIGNLSLILKRFEEKQRSDLTYVALHLQTWKIKVWKMKAIYHTMNLFLLDEVSNYLVSEGWVPVKDLHTINNVLDCSCRDEGNNNSTLHVMGTSDVPPTLIRNNKFTIGFQNLIDCYGLATHREVNPALCIIITFPFLFGVMFGDVGHGLLLLMFAAYMIVREKHFLTQSSKNEIWELLFAGRYIILMMGLFSMYAGLIYNDVFSLSFNLFGSSWKVNYNHSSIEENKFLQLNPSGKDYSQFPYPLGMDPVWQLGKNKLIFVNSFKMKMAIILGVFHMLLGLFLNFLNHRFLRKSIYFLIPRLLFFLCTFCYLTSMIILKWFFYDDSSSEKYRKAECAPSILILVINMVMFTRLDNKDGCEAYMYKDQYVIQIFLMVTVLICILLMLIIEPIHVLYLDKKRRNPTRYWRITDSTESLLSPFEEISEADLSSTATHQGSSDYVEVWIQQMSSSVEYILGTISHTASYLRLWAISLAHTQLSHLLWSKVMRVPFLLCRNYFGGLLLFVGFAVWAFLTFTIILMMHGLVAFLHSLRLHWMEFMSKFFCGNGYPFQPFSLQKIIREIEESSNK